jgi:hypothetical protein
METHFILADMFQGMLVIKTSVLLIHVLIHGFTNPRLRKSPLIDVDGRNALEVSAFENFPNYYEIAIDT